MKRNKRKRHTEPRPSIKYPTPLYSYITTFQHKVLHWKKRKK